MPQWGQAASQDTKWVCPEHEGSVSSVEVTVLLVALGVPAVKTTVQEIHRLF
jgi:hypothetical protein